jgi:hypothetical protein
MVLKAIELDRRSTRLAALQDFHEFLKVRLKIGEQWILPMFKHDLPEQFQANGERCCRFGGEPAARLNPVNDIEYVVVVAGYKCKRRMGTRIAMVIGDLLDGNAELMFHADSCR